MFMLVLSIGYVSAQGKADIKFDKTSHNFGTFSENDPVVSCVFTFTNVGDAPLVIHQAVASCGCTVPEYTGLWENMAQHPCWQVTFREKQERSRLLTTEQVNIRDTSKSPSLCARMPKQK